VVFGDGRHGDKALGAVEDIGITVLESLGLEGSRVRTGIGLGQGEGDDVAAVRDAGEVFFLLLIGCKKTKKRSIMPVS
jgi:hypothetical protein